MQGAQEVLESPKCKAFLNRQNKAGPQTAKAETTAKNTRQQRRQAPDRRDIAHPDLPISVLVLVFFPC